MATDGRRNPSRRDETGWVESHLPEKAHLLILLLVIADDLRRGHADLHPVDDKLPGTLERLAVKAGFL